MWPFKKNQVTIPSVHFDHASGNDFDKNAENDFNLWLSNQNGKLPKICCTRFQQAIDDNEIKYSYRDTSSIDETAWYIEGMWHIYFCPFYRLNIQGGRFGNVEV